MVCVLVTFRRPDLLRRGLTALAHQRRRPDLVIVVDNDADPAVAELVGASELPTTYLPSERNLGGAGGYAYGVVSALAAGADWVWFADDDGVPADEWTLSRLLVCAVENELSIVCPVVLDQDDPSRLAFPLRHGMSWLTRRDQLPTTLLHGTGNLFNGTLMTAAAVHAIGLPDIRLFVRGDEVDVHRRVKRSGLGFGTCTASCYRHPQGRDDWQPLARGRLSVLVPADRARRETTYRNLGYLTAQRGLRWRRWLDAARYGWWYLGVRHDVAGARQWWQLSRQGRKEQFPAFEMPPVSRSAVTPSTPAGARAVAGTRHTASSRHPAQAPGAPPPNGGWALRSSV